MSAGLAALPQRKGQRKKHTTNVICLFSLFICTPLFLDFHLELMGGTFVVGHTCTASFDNDARFHGTAISAGHKKADVCFRHALQNFGGTTFGPLFPCHVDTPETTAGTPRSDAMLSTAFCPARTLSGRLAVTPFCVEEPPRALTGMAERSNKHKSEVSFPSITVSPLAVTYGIRFQPYA